MKNIIVKLFAVFTLIRNTQSSQCNGRLCRGPKFKQSNCCSNQICVLNVHSDQEQLHCVNERDYFKISTLDELTDYKTGFVPENKPLNELAVRSMGTGDRTVVDYMRHPKKNPKEVHHIKVGETNNNIKLENNLRPTDSSTGNISKSLHDKSDKKINSHRPKFRRRKRHRKIKNKNPRDISDVKYENSKNTTVIALSLNSQSGPQNSSVKKVNEKLKATTEENAKAVQHIKVGETNNNITMENNLRPSDRSTGNISKSLHDKSDKKINPYWPKFRRRKRHRKIKNKNPRDISDVKYENSKNTTVIALSLNSQSGPQNSSVKKVNEKLRPTTEEPTAKEKLPVVIDMLKEEFGVKVKHKSLAGNKGSTKAQSHLEISNRSGAKNNEKRSGLRNINGKCSFSPCQGPEFKQNNCCENFFCVQNFITGQNHCVNKNEYLYYHQDLWRSK